MFTFKKIALLGAAGLAAFSMSCSDDEGSTDSNRWSKEFKASDNGDNIVLEGEITAVGGDKVKSLNITVNDVKVAIHPSDAPTLPSEKVTLDNVKLSNACGSINGDQKVDIKIEVTFENSTTPLTAEAKVDAKCPSLAGLGKKWSFTLSNAGESYADLDNFTKYKQAAAITNKLKIDLIAYDNSVVSPAENKIFVPVSVKYRDIFGGADFFAGAGSDFAEIFELTASAAASAKTLLNGEVTPEAAAGYASSLWDEYDALDEEGGTSAILVKKSNEGIDIAADKVFVVFSAGEEFAGIYGIIVKSTGTNTVELQSVTLE